ncbi:hypothetical protein AB7M49_005926 [Bradyrhizobium elkanii]
MTVPRCSCCDDTRWVCEAHPDQLGIVIEKEPDASQSDGSLH